MIRTELGSAEQPLWRVVRARGRSWGAVIAVGAGVMFGASLVTVAQAREQASTLPSIAFAELPVQAQETHRLILKGGPFPYPKDGIAFGNRERVLPPKARGHYQEYTVKTPGSRDRGARRIVCGGELPARPEICYYTDDHYASFRSIAP